MFSVGQEWGLMLAMQGEERGDSWGGVLFHGLLLEQKACVMACPSWDEGLVPISRGPISHGPISCGLNSQGPISCCTEVERGALLAPGPLQLSSSLKAKPLSWLSLATDT